MGLKHIFLCRLWHSHVNIFLIGWHMSVTQEWVICFHMWCVYEIEMRIPFSKQYRYVINHLNLYVNKYFHFFLHSNPITVYYMSGTISWKTTATTVLIFDQISTGPIFTKYKYTHCHTYTFLYSNFNYSSSLIIYLPRTLTTTVI